MLQKISFTQHENNKSIKVFAVKWSHCTAAFGSHHCHGSIFGGEQVFHVCSDGYFTINDLQFLRVERRRSLQVQFSLDPALQLKGTELTSSITSFKSTFDLLPNEGGGSLIVIIRLPPSKISGVIPNPVLQIPALTDFTIVHRNSPVPPFTSDLQSLWKFYHRQKIRVRSRPSRDVHP